MADTKTVIEQAYSAFNQRDIDGALALMTEDVSWPKASEGGRVQGKEEIRAYWTRQWSEFDGRVEPLEIVKEDGDKIRVRVHQRVKNLEGSVLWDGEVFTYSPYAVTSSRPWTLEINPIRPVPQPHSRIDHDWIPFAGLHFHSLCKCGHEQASVRVTCRNSNETKRMKTLIVVLLVPALSVAQTPRASVHGGADSPVHELRSHPDWPVAQSGDVSSIHGIVEAFFSAISAPKGGTLDRERLRSLFVPNGRVELLVQASGAQPTDVAFVSPDVYADRSDAATKDEGFIDHALSMRVQQFGVMAHVYSAYESRRNRDDVKPFFRGVKSFELLNSGGRWYITQVAWDRESEDNPIPEVYLHNSPQ